MTQQDKYLLLRDLCARLPYNTCQVSICGHTKTLRNGMINLIGHDKWNIKPYLRPLSSLTQEERNKFCDIGGVISHKPSDGKLYLVAYFPEALDYLNSIHADYRGLIEKGLAIEVTKENNPYK